MPHVRQLDRVVLTKSFDGAPVGSTGIVLFIERDDAMVVFSDENGTIRHVVTIPAVLLKVRERDHPNQR